MSKIIDISGKRFGKLIVIKRGPNLPSSSNAMWLCLCECGKTSNVYGPSLRKGRTTSCNTGDCRYTKRSIADRFARYTIPEPNSGCLLWLGAHDSKNYGQLRISKTSLKRASHIALALAGRPVPDGMIACHRCDNPFCVEETHLFHGTQLDNVSDMMRKRRHDHSGLSLGRSHAQ